MCVSEKELEHLLLEMREEQDVFGPVHRRWRTLGRKGEDRQIPNNGEHAGRTVCTS